MLGEVFVERRIGFIVNPIAGMGGPVGLKGTDGDAYLEALRRGARPIAPLRALRFLRSLKCRPELIVADGPMGLNIVREAGLASLVSKIIDHVGEKTSREDTVRIARKMKSTVDLLVFVGGDGTARDILDAVDKEIPVLGVPSGVKIYSAVFAVTPEAAARVVDAFCRGEATITEREVLDIDEEEFRRNRLRVRLYGYLLVPVAGDLVQPSKGVSLLAGDEAANAEAIARWIIDNMERNTLYLLGPGTTVKAVGDILGIDKTLLGVDAVYNGRLIGKDLDEKGILSLLGKYGSAYIIVTPIGRQGFIFGRGNRQFTPRVLRRVGRDNIIVVATRRKISGLCCLRVDTGDPSVDRMLRGYIRVLVDYGYFVVKKVV
jgi:predicted polyphosphate/ATP-dependent NAD kinase